MFLSLSKNYVDKSDQPVCSYSNMLPLCYPCRRICFNVVMFQLLKSGAFLI